MVDAWKIHLTIEACGSCHNTTSWVSPAPAGMTMHTGGVQANGSCTACHSGTAIEGYHVVPIPAVDEPEFDVTLGITPPAAGGFYVEDEAPVVTVTLQNHADGSAVDPAFYTTARGAAGDTTDTALRVASVYIYGPRAMSKPVMATNTAMDPLHDPRTPPTQGHMLFTGGMDPLVQSDATGFRYQLLPIPAGMEPGTYLIRVRFADYSRVAAGDYHIESTARMTIQIGTATEEPKASGDACVGCHGTGNFLRHDERHSASFDTDNCLSCRDQSGNHAVPIGNRIHAIHSANSDGDIYSIEGGFRNWDDVTFPSDPQRCTICHTSGSTTYQTNPLMMPCAGCHVQTGNGALGHMQSNGGPYPRADH
ncbi:MAG: hypothetical protein OEY14_15030 [Myxococcales bacterium]|nr:hypothetical protein [Myxococcales bacterium]